MAEPNRTYEQQQNVESHAPYGTVFFVLLNFTAMEYIYASFYHSSSMFVLLMMTAIALTLLTLVASKLLHLEFNRRWAYLTILPALGLAITGTAFPLVLGLLILAVTKAALVGIYFMHLKFEGRWVFMTLIPPTVLAVIFVALLYPDIGLQRGQDEEVDDETTASAPAESASTQPTKP